jgi:hypothetical protein
MIEKYSEQSEAPTEAGPEAFPIKANDFAAITQGHFRLGVKPPAT